MVDRKNQMDKIQSNPLMVKSLTGRISWIEFSKSSPYGEIPHGKRLCEVQMVGWLSIPTVWLGNPSFIEE
jgi:hypothetical protein